MSGPEGIDERFGTLVGELRSGEQTASPELRERVRAIAARGPEPPAATRRDRFPRRRIALVLGPVCALVAITVGAGLLTSGSGRKAQSSHDVALPGTVQRSAGSQNAASGAVPKSPPLPATGAAGLNTYSDVPAPSGSRHQLYSADLR